MGCCNNSRSTKNELRGIQNNFTRSPPAVATAARTARRHASGAARSARLVGRRGALPHPRRRVRGDPRSSRGRHGSARQRHRHPQNPPGVAVSPLAVAGELAREVEGRASCGEVARVWIEAARFGEGVCVLSAAAGFGEVCVDVCVVRGAGSPRAARQVDPGGPRSGPSAAPAKRTWRVGVRPAGVEPRSSAVSLGFR